MWFIIRFGTDGIGLDAGRVFAYGIDNARTLADAYLRATGNRLQSDKGLFTVHGERN